MQGYSPDYSYYLWVKIQVDLENTFRNVYKSLIGKHIDRFYTECYRIPNKGNKTY